MRSKLIALLAAVLLTAACSQQGSRPAQPQIRPLVPLVSGENRQLLQHLQVRYRGERKDLVAATLLDPQLLKLSLLSPQGVSLLDIQYDGGQVNAKRYLPGTREIPAEALLADLQLVYWPLQLLRDGLSGEWELTEQMDGEGLQRQLFYKGRLHTRVTYSEGDIWAAQVQLEQKSLDYSLNIRNL